MKRADVVLVYPQRAPAQGRHWIMPSLGLMYLSASLRQRRLHRQAHRPHLPRAREVLRRDRAAAAVGDRDLLHDHDAGRGPLAGGSRSAARH